MPCYVEHARPANRSEYAEWQKIGFLGSWERYCEMKARSGDGKYTICGDLGAHCHRCAGVGDFLCDFPVGDGKTCDAPMCEQHAHEIGIELHYCQAHYDMWQQFKASGGVDKALCNVVAFKSEK